MEFSGGKKETTTGLNQHSTQGEREKRERDGDMSIYIPHCSHTRIYMRKAKWGHHICLYFSFFLLKKLIYSYYNTLVNAYAWNIYSFIMKFVSTDY